MKDQHDSIEDYCRMLGHHLSFGYCRTMANGTPCFKILDCWFENFDVKSFIEEHYEPEEIKAFLTPPKPKMASLVELIQKAKEGAGN